MIHLFIMLHLSKNLHSFDVPEIHLNDGNFIYGLLLTIITSSKRRLFQLLLSFLASNFVFFHVFVWVPLIILCFILFKTQIFLIRFAPCSWYVIRYNLHTNKQEEENAFNLAW